jgi:hypothetical protein
MEWVITPLIIALIVTGAKAFQAWVVWKKHRLEETERLRKFTASLRTDLILTAPKFPTTYSPPPVPSAGVVLASEVGVDYTKLRNLLVARKFKEADQETARIMLWVACREKEGWLDEESINKFPCQDLLTIDQLWVQKSNGRFGFSVQKEIYNQVGKDFDKFADQVEWKVGKEWKNYNELMFEMRAPRGHLSVIGGGGWGEAFWVSLLSRRDL